MFSRVLFGARASLLAGVVSVAIAAGIGVPAGLLAGFAGGLTLARDASAIRLGDVVRDAEPNLHLVECFDRSTNTCPIIGVCDLKSYLGAAYVDPAAGRRTRS